MVQSIKITVDKSMLLLTKCVLTECLELIDHSISDTLVHYTSQMFIF